MISDDGNETKTVCEDLVLNNGGVVKDVTLLNSKGVDFGHHNSPERVGD